QRDLAASPRPLLIEYDNVAVRHAGNRMLKVQGVRLVELIICQHALTQQLILQIRRRWCARRMRIDFGFELATRLTIGLEAVSGIIDLSLHCSPMSPVQSLVPWEKRRIAGYLVEQDCHVDGGTWNIVGNRLPLAVSMTSRAWLVTSESGVWT